MTRAARSRKPCSMPSKAAKKAMVSATIACPTTDETVRRNRRVATLRARRLALVGIMSNWKTRLSRKRTRRAGASRPLGIAEEGVAWSLNELAVLGHRRRRSSGEPAVMLRDALLVHQRLGDRWRMASVFEEIAGAVLVRRDAPLAVRLIPACQERPYTWSDPARVQVEGE